MELPDMIKTINEIKNTFDGINDQKLRNTDQ